MIRISKDKTVLVGFAGRVFSAENTYAEIKKLTVFVSDDENKIRFDIDNHVKEHLDNKGYFIYFQCIDNQLDMIKVNIK